VLLNIREYVCILSGSIIAPFIQIDAAARVCCRAHVYVPSLFIRPPNQSLSRPDLYDGDVVYSVCVSLSRSCLLLMSPCVAIISVIAQIRARWNSS